jgi:hypothetical protein
MLFERGFGIAPPAQVAFDLALEKTPLNSVLALMQMPS